MKQFILPLIVLAAMTGLCSSADKSQAPTPPVPVVVVPPTPIPIPAPLPTLPTIDGATQVETYKMVDESCVGNFEEARWSWYPSVGVDYRVSSNKKTVTFTAAPGTYTLSLTGINWTLKVFETTTKVITVSGPIIPPGPTPIPPGPTPIPIPVIPPAPVPAVPPIVVPTSGQYVLIVEDVAARASLPAAQLEILTGTAPGSVREYLAAHCAKSATGNPEFRILDVNSSMAQETVPWVKSGFARPRGGSPWILISNTKAGTEQALPATAADTLALLKKYEVQP